MKALVLGASGFFGGVTARRLAEGSVFRSVHIASRSAEKANNVAKALGDKGQPVVVDFDDEEAMIEAAQEVDVVVNVTGPALETSLPGLLAAVRAGVHYCDISAEVGVLDAAMSHESEIDAAGVGVVIGAGFHPGITDLLAIKAVDALDKADGVSIFIVGTLSDYGDAATLISSIDAGWEGSEGFKTIITGVGTEATFIEAGQPVGKSACAFEKRVSTPDGFEVLFGPFATHEPMSIHRKCPELPDASMHYGLWPVTAQTKLASRAEDAVNGRYGTGQILRDILACGLDASEEGPKIHYWATSIGEKNGKSSTATVYSTGEWCTNGQMISTTTGMLALTAERLAAGRIQARGLLTASDVFDPDEVFSVMAGPDDPQLVVDFS